MDLHQVIASAVEEVLDGIKAANKELEGKARVGDPAAVEIEFGLTSTYEVANYDDVRVATATVRIPLFAPEPPAKEPPTVPVVVEKEKAGKKAK